MTEAEFQKWIRNFNKIQNEAEEKRQMFLKEVVPGILKITLEGFTSNHSTINLSNDLIIEKESDEKRDVFFERVATLELSDFKSANNSFFLTYHFKDQRQRIGGIETGSRIQMIAIFFSICTNKLIKINKSQEFAYVQNELKSFGITRIPNAPWAYDRNAEFDTSDIDRLKMFWPLFRNCNEKFSQFSLAARRFYFSLTRYQWEDKVIDLMIALEALLVPEIEESSKGAKMAKRLSRLLSAKFLRGDVSQVTRKCYDLRNEVVHGKANFDEGIYTIVELMQSYTKAALQEYLENHNGLSVQELVLRLEQMKGDQI